MNIVSVNHTFYHTILKTTEIYVCIKSTKRKSLCHITCKIKKSTYNKHHIKED